MSDHQIYRNIPLPERPEPAVRVKSPGVGRGNGRGPGVGILSQVHAQAIKEARLKTGDLTVLSDQNDPFRRGSPACERDGRWFAAQMDRFYPGRSRVHLRGAHYKVSSSATVIKPNGRPYLNDADDWLWFQKVSATARWLSFVRFEQIVDERNAEASDLTVGYEEPQAWLSGGSTVAVPSAERCMPSLQCSFDAQQPYRLVFMGEKSSLEDELKPVATRYNAELFLPTGESTATRVAEMAARAAEDGRPTVIFYFSDFDPSGWQMPVSVARKLQGLVAMLYPDLDIQVRPVAITLEQAIQYDLPSTPLKAEERRADKWKAAFGREQTEIDALMALHPGALARIAREAIRPFYDADLDVDVHEAQREWLQEARLTLQAHPDWETLRKEMEVVRRDAADAVQRLEAVQSRAEKVLANVVLPEMYVREAEVRDYAAGPALFHSTDDYITASKRLIAHKALSPIDAGDGE